MSTWAHRHYFEFSMNSSKLRNTPHTIYGMDWILFVFIFSKWKKNDTFLHFWSYLIGSCMVAQFVHVYLWHVKCWQVKILTRLSFIVFVHLSALNPSPSLVVCSPFSLHTYFSLWCRSVVFSPSFFSFVLFRNTLYFMFVVCSCFYFKVQPLFHLYTSACRC